jgi:hypothetical protein
MYLLTLPFLTLPIAVTARIVGIAAPATMAPGSTFRVTIITANDIQAYQDTAIVFGISPAGAFHSGSLGTLLSEKFLGPGRSPSIHYPECNL